MISRFIQIHLLVVLTIIFNCSEKGTNSQTNDINDETISHIISIQKEKYDLLVSLYESMDTNSAQEAVLNSFLTDDAVESGNLESQGIVIQYKSGIIGGIYLSGRSNTNSKLKKIETKGILPTKHNAKRYFPMPNSKKTVYINPLYSNDFFALGKQILDSLNIYLPLAGYSIPVTFLDAGATVSSFTSLNEFGIIYINTHGFYYSHPTINEVFIMTGQTPSNQDFNEFISELRENNIAIVYNGAPDVIKHANKYCLRSRYFFAKNDFSKDTILFYGAFCNSHFGKWPEDFTDAAAQGAYISFDGMLQVNYNVKWSLSFFKHLTDVSQKSPMTVKDWFITRPTNYLVYLNEESNKYVHMLYTGCDSLTLWQIETNLTGNWIGTELMHYKQNIGGLISEDTISGEGNFEILQTDNTIEIKNPQVNIVRTGTITGNGFEVTGKAAVPGNDVVVSENSFTGTGTIIDRNTIELNGEGIYTGHQDGQSFEITYSSIATMYRTGDKVLLNKSTNRDNSMTYQQMYNLVSNLKCKSN